MQKSSSSRSAPAGRRLLQIEDSLRLSRTILRCANRGLPRNEFLLEISAVLLDSSGCDALEVRLNDGDVQFRWEVTRRPEHSVCYELVQWTLGSDGRVIPAAQDGSDLERLCSDVACRRFDAAQPFFTRNGSFWTGNTWGPLALGGAPDQDGRTPTVCVGGHYRSLAVIRFFVDDRTIGLLHIKSERPDCFTEEEIEFYEGVAQTVGLATAIRRAQAALRERVKELTCLYGIAHVIERPGASLQKILGHIVTLLPPAWQYPEITAARIILDGRPYVTPGFGPGKHLQSADIVVGGRKRGTVEVAYLEDRPEFAVGTFLAEEEKLIVAVAREVALIVERREAGEEKSKLQRQLIHADRLATIGQLAAGVAHELNEPLGSILGFAQLVQRCPDLPQPAGRDTEKIITASLYAREVIKKLMVFARQMPPKKVPVDLNQVVEDGFYFLEARCVKAGIEVARDLARDLPQITADPAQLKQVLVNLVVNAVQAMPDGGTLTVGTQADDGTVSLVVRDTGVGMSPEIQERIFLPFFTTKDVDEGTGIGLAVVHGIVTAHGGSIEVQSQPGAGTRFEIRLPVDGAGATQETGHDDCRD